jgi:hypothetical protein
MNALLPGVILAAVVVTFQPAAPTVGDRITVQFDGPVRLEKSRQYEIVEQQGGRVVVRTFSPKPFALAGKIGDKTFRNLQIPVKSVLEPDDDLKPAPLRPPQPVPYPRAPFAAIAAAAACAIGAWAGVWWLARRKTPAIAMPPIPADERFRRAVGAAKAQPERWAALADATRSFLAETRPQLGSDLTTTELLPRLREEERIVREILRQGDLEKFSIDGAEPENFDDVAQRALELAS